MIPKAKSVSRQEVQDAHELLKRAYRLLLALCSAHAAKCECQLCPACGGAADGCRSMARAIAELTESS